MTNTIDAIYKNIGQNIFNEMTENWDKAIIHAELHGDAGKFNGEYIDNGITKYFEVYDDALDDFEELNKITTEGGKNKWNRASFTLLNTGKFNIDFEWDQALADEIERLS